MLSNDPRSMCLFFPSFSGPWDRLSACLSSVLFTLPSHSSSWHETTKHPVGKKRCGEAVWLWVGWYFKGKVAASFTSPDASYMWCRLTVGLPGPWASPPWCWLLSRERHCTCLPSWWRRSRMTTLLISGLWDASFMNSTRGRLLSPQPPFCT